jgi:hypothetical protein
MFGFEPDNQQRLVFRYRNYELRRKPHDQWLLRKLSKIDSSRSEMLVKWFMTIPPNDYIWAMMCFTKGLK